jgi:hypothetical protein
MQLLEASRNVISKSPHHTSQSIIQLYRVGISIQVMHMISVLYHQRQSGSRPSKHALQVFNKFQQELVETLAAYSEQLSCSSSARKRGYNINNYRHIISTNAFVEGSCSVLHG